MSFQSAEKQNVRFAFPSATPPTDGGIPVEASLGTCHAVSTGSRHPVRSRFMTRACPSTYRIAFHKFIMRASFKIEM